MAWYGLATYRAEDSRRAGLLIGDVVYDLERAFGAANPGAAPPPQWLTRGVGGMLADWSAVAPEIDALAERTAEWAAQGRLEPVSDGLQRLAAPFRPGRIFAAAANFVEHANEMGTVLAAKANSRPYVFLKADSSVVGPGETVILPPESNQVDWEVELGVVIGREARRVPEAWALDYVAGYTVVNDVSARDLNVRSDFPFRFDWFQGKSFDTFAPLGPCVVPKGCIADPQKLRLRLSVNDAVMQDATTEEMIFTVTEQVAYLSDILTLRPGDVIATGTPTGVGMGRGVFLRDGDVMEAWIERIGSLRNPVAAERAETATGPRSPAAERRAAVEK